ncbi:B- and T-lymphocyte attenuator-like [Poeciliopsis prolifica]|uniref:B- and T-lymphocyte attenuator-like n=1 Tax=Poeciliopsis prolifica TaxID=188132 RepID=UPI002413704E|nr:B- and T-lymphocyte attenuator-like [Poeciliopsis prolifica]
MAVSSCDVTTKVPRGETKRVSTGQNLKVKCPVQHCGKSFNVGWSKFSATLANWEAIPDTENIKITQKYDKENVISYLSFEQVSINDDGLYQCTAGHNNEVVGHSINISVSEPNKGVENPDDDADSIDDGRSSLFIFLICVIIIFLIAAAIVWVPMCFHGWKQTWTCNNKNKAKISTHKTPESRAPSSPSLKTQISVLNDIYSSCKPGTTSPSPALTLTGNASEMKDVEAKLM